eukprot:CAMPEP_0182811016 /NCGR_PEP_ID=MMETSP0006_2-20121128/8045_1 /TAXON_ID=97485 /ORGANISM="Prymnesium parvum, Strain Texoma1" /LENGTH=248 /DNA_ID=CAMNT_0024936945 /DNA_START=19 /DNA_END=766 /DNA_ORIENTATION=-
MGSTGKRTAKLVVEVIGYAAQDIRTSSGQRFDRLAAEDEFVISASRSSAGPRRTLASSLPPELVEHIASIEDFEEQLRAVRAAANASARAAEMAHAKAMANPLWARRDVEYALRRHELQHQSDERLSPSAHLSPQAFKTAAPNRKKGGTNPVRRRKLKARPVAANVPGAPKPHPPPARPPGRDSGPAPAFRVRGFLRLTPFADDEDVGNYSKDRPHPKESIFSDRSEIEVKRPVPMFPPLPQGHVSAS